jgi:hypothetical protein
LLASARHGASPVLPRDAQPEVSWLEGAVTRTQSLVLTGLAGLLLALVLLNAFLFSGNREIQREIAQRNQVIQQSLQLEPIYQWLVRALAEAAVGRQDEALRSLLASEGIQVSATTPQSAPDATTTPIRQ